MASIDLEVYTDEWLLNPYQFVSLLPGVIVAPGQRITKDMVGPMGDITGALISLTIRDLASPTFTPMVFDTNGAPGAQIIIDNNATAVWHYSVNNSFWTPDLVSRSQQDRLQYSLVLSLNNMPKRMWGGCFKVSQG